MQFPMTGQERLILNTDDCLIEVTSWAGLNVHINDTGMYPTMIVSHRYPSKITNKSSGSQMKLSP